MPGCAFASSLTNYLKFVIELFFQLVVNPTLLSLTVLCSVDKRSTTRSIDWKNGRVVVAECVFIVTFAIFFYSCHVSNAAVFTGRTAAAGLVVTYALCPNGRDLRPTVDH